MKYLGCWNAGSAYIRDLPYDATVTNSMTVEYCQNLCLTNNWRYAALSNGNQCFCGPSYGYEYLVVVLINSILVSTEVLLRAVATNLVLATLTKCAAHSMLKYAIINF